MAEEVTATEEVIAEKSTKSRFIVIAVVLLALIGAGAAWYFGQTKNHTAASGQSAEVKSATPVFMTLETFTVNLTGDSGEQYLQTDISLQLTEASNEALLKQVMPLIKAQIVMILSSKGASEISNMEGKNALAQEIVDAINTQLPNARNGQAVNGVFFTSFIIQ